MHRDVTLTASTVCAPEDLDEMVHDSWSGFLGFFFFSVQNKAGKTTTGLAELLLCGSKIAWADTQGLCPSSAAGDFF
jgi:hypothetical protein